jgi:hypothetical protein
MANMILTLLSTDEIEQHTATGHWRDRTIYVEAAGHAQRAPTRLPRATDSAASPIAS